MLYHISTEVKNTPHKFYPRIPRKTLGVEDRITERISFCPSISDCLSAFSYKQQSLKRFKKNKLYLSCYELDEKDYQEFIVHSETLYSEGRVKDALLTKEHWLKDICVILQPKIIQITNLEYEVEFHNGEWIQLAKNVIPIPVDFSEEYVQSDDWATKLDSQLPHRLRKVFLST